MQIGAEGAVLLSTVVGAPWALSDKKLAGRARGMLREGERVDVELSLNWKTIEGVVRVPQWHVKMLGLPRVAVAAENVEVQEEH